MLNLAKQSEQNAITQEMKAWQRKQNSNFCLDVPIEGQRSPPFLFSFFFFFCWYVYFCLAVCVCWLVFC